MVSSGPLILCVAAVVATHTATAQSSQPLLNASSRSAAPGADAAKPPVPVLSLESRADILMARKMYREAIDLYKQGPADSAIIWNKIGIAYHQMLQLDAARKHYEKSLKLNPRYPEAINNLGTVYYATKSYRRATGLYRRALQLAPPAGALYSKLRTPHFPRKRKKEA